VIHRLLTFGRRLKGRLLRPTAEESRLRALLEAYTTPNFMHPPIAVNTATPWILDPDPVDDRSRQAVGRVVEAYHRAMKDFEPPARSMWDVIQDGHGDFIDGLHGRSLEAVGKSLGRMFQSELIWGLGHVSPVHATWLRENPRSPIYLGLTDGLVSLGEAVGARRVVSIQQQGVRAHEEALLVDPVAVLEAIEGKTELDLSFPKIGAACGFRFGDRLVTLDSLWHSYTLYRLRQLGASSHSSMMEIGGGYGCLAYFAYKAGHRRYVIVDLPWVNALQGYFLIMALPPGAVRLYGETGGEIAVLPHWCVRSLPDRSVDYVVNSDSMPEMGIETARDYVRQVARLLRPGGLFLSINQEGRGANADVGPQNWVADLIAEHGGFRVASRQRGWMRQGYVEEVFVGDTISDLREVCRR
jgi:SAM-dependent methyltransferase